MARLDGGERRRRPAQGLAALTLLAAPLTTAQSMSVDPAVGSPGVDGLVDAFVWSAAEGALYAFGAFTSAGGAAANRAARWTSGAWQALGAGLNNRGLAALALPPSLGGGIVVAGSFTTASGVFAKRIARWDGAAFSPLGAGLNGLGLALAVHDDGAGQALYVGGTFTTAGGVAASRVARWNGAQWSAVGQGFAVGAVRALCAGVAAGSGPALYAAVDAPAADGSGAASVWRWTGAQWEGVGGGFDGAIFDLAIYQGDLYACGAFSTADGAPALRIARFDGLSWSGLGGGLNAAAQRMALFDDGAGEQLVVAGDFLQADGVAVQRLAAWDGVGFAPLPVGGPDGPVQSLCSYVDTAGVRRLAVAGEFFHFGGELVERVVEIVGPAARVPGDVDGDGTVGPSDLFLLLGNWGATNSPVDADGDGAVGPSDLFVLLGNWGRTA